MTFLANDGEVFSTHLNVHLLIKTLYRYTLILSNLEISHSLCQRRVFQRIEDHSTNKVSSPEEAETEVASEEEVLQVASEEATEEASEEEVAEEETEEAEAVASEVEEVATDLV